MIIISSVIRLIGVMIVELMRMNYFNNVMKWECDGVVGGGVGGVGKREGCM